VQASPLQATGRAPGTAAPTSVHTPLAASGGGGAKDAKRRLQIDPDYTVLEPDEGMGDPGACVRVGVWVCGCVGVSVHVCVCVGVCLWGGGEGRRVDECLSWVMMSSWALSGIVRLK